MRQRLRLKNKHRSWTALRQSQGWTRKSWLYVLHQMKGLINLGISLINFFFPVCWSEGGIFMLWDKVLLWSSDSLELSIFLPELECSESIQVLTRKRKSRECCQWDIRKFSNPRNGSRNFSKASSHRTGYGYEMISLLKQLVATLVLASSIDLVILTFVVSMLYTGSVATIQLIPEEEEKQIKWLLIGLVSGSSGCPKLSM